ncbi:prenylated rab acceptor protein [Anaeramoeba ignava]|uniref:PRA1 family protein n=1 Tax=Anaeramoeba ignava TaxID=1746090 RepID=A0A9Q0R8P2_ANAIG|nr:prenylated rab acceptor protein [Anaeramoeba ignava]
MTFKPEPWRYFVQHFEFPSISEISKRFKKNINYFFPNYFWVFITIFIFVFISNYRILIGLIIPFGLYYYFFKINKEKNIIFDAKKVLILNGLNLFNILLTSIFPNSLWIILFISFLIIIHAIFHSNSKIEIEKKKNK